MRRYHLKPLMRCKIDLLVKAGFLAHQGLAVERHTMRRLISISKA
jgi:hypothetical protein